MNLLSTKKIVISNFTDQEFNKKLIIVISIPFDRENVKENELIENRNRVFILYKCFIIII